MAFWKPNGFRHSKPRHLALGPNFQGFFMRVRQYRPTLSNVWPIHADRGFHADRRFHAA